MGDGLGGEGLAMGSRIANDSADYPSLAARRLLALVEQRAREEEDENEPRCAICVRAENPASPWRGKLRTFELRFRPPGRTGQAILVGLIRLCGGCWAANNA